MPHFSVSLPIGGRLVSLHYVIWMTNHVKSSKHVVESLVPERHIFLLKEIKMILKSLQDIFHSGSKIMDTNLTSEEYNFLNWFGTISGNPKKSLP